jgi:SOS response associated peptidase (SRAP)
MRWGLIPSWAKDASIGYKMINARAETVATKPAFNPALMRRYEVSSRVNLVKNDDAACAEAV